MKEDHFALDQRAINQVITTSNIPQLGYYFLGLKSPSLSSVSSSYCCCSFLWIPAALEPVWVMLSNGRILGFHNLENIIPTYKTKNKHTYNSTKTMPRDHNSLYVQTT